MRSVPEVAVSSSNYIGTHCSRTEREIGLGVPEDCTASQLTALGNDNVHVRDIPPFIPRLGVLHLVHDIHAVNYLAEDNVLPVEERSGHGGDEELASVGVGTRVLYFQNITPR